MWIILKLIVMIGAFFFRLAGKSLPPKISMKRELNGNRYFIKAKWKKRVVASTTVIIDFNCSLIFKITQEGFWDRLFKKLMIAEEIQTSDGKFDEKFYIASDTPAFKMAIRNEQKIRKIIYDLFGTNCQHIFCDGSSLWCTFPGDQRENSSLVQMCVSLKQQLAEIKPLSSSMNFDPFSIKILIVEAVIYSLAAYGLAGFAEMYFLEKDVYLNPFLLMQYGLIKGVLATLIFIAIVVIILRRSSRAHRVIIESAVVLSVSMPIACIQISRDINIGFDKSEPVMIEAKVVRRHIQEPQQDNGTMRGIKGSRRTYHLEIEPMNGAIEFEIPRHVKISRQQYDELSASQVVTLTIGKGYLNLPWYKSIEP